MVPNQVMQIRLTAAEVAIYNYLLYCEDRKTYQCYPSYNSIGQALGLSKNTVRKYVKSLEEKCLIYTEPTTVILKSGKKQNGNLLYTIRPIKDAVDYFYQQQIKRVEQAAIKERVQKRLQEYDRRHPKKAV